MVPVNLLANYHLASGPTDAFARNAGAPSYGATQPAATVTAPNHDIDNQGRPQLGAFDRGADELGALSADLSITKTDGVTSTTPGATLTYTITVSNAGPDAVTGATVADTLGAGLTGTNLNTTVDLAAGASHTYTLTATVAASASLSVSNTATVTAPASTTDPAAGNNSATDVDNVVGNRPTPAVLDNFNRTATSLGANWSQLNLFGVALRTNGTTAFANSGGNAYWNGTTGGGPTYGNKQAAQFTLANATVNGDSLILKSSGGVVLGTSQNAIRVRYDSVAGQVVVETTNVFAIFTQTGALPASLVNGDTLTALANTDGSVDVWKTTAANVTTYLGRSAAAAAFTGTGRIGIQLNSGAFVDNFAGGTVA
jgi:uncharacterized repeat protein (TIGR01451 family)